MSLFFCFAAKDHEAQQEKDVEAENVLTCDIVVALLVKITSTETWGYKLIES